MKDVTSFDRLQVRQYPPFIFRTLTRDFFIGVKLPKALFCTKNTLFFVGNSDACLEETHKSVVEEIKHWVTDYNEPPIYWLRGSAGREKSVIAWTITESMNEAGQLGAFFFCSRDPENQDLSNPKLIFPTLAAYLALGCDGLASRLSQVTNSESNIVHWLLEPQMKKLIIEPLRQSGSPNTVIVIDAIDECEDEESVKQILSLIRDLVIKVPSVKLLVTSCRDPPEGFTLLAGPGGPTSMLVLREVELSGVRDNTDKLMGCPQLQNLQKLADGGGGEKNLAAGSAH